MMKDEGVVLARTVYGYRRILRADGSVRIVRDKEEARIVVFAFDLAADGLGQRDVAENLNAQGYRRKTGANGDSL